MGTILGFAKLLSKQLEPGDARQGMIGAITQELRAMDHLISDLLSFGKHVELNCQPLPLTPFLERIIAQVPVQDGIAKPAVVVDVPGGIPPIYGDELLLRQAFSNLVQNALEAMASGGELRVSARFIPKSTVEIIVKDSGTGIHPENLERIFLPFFTTKARGTGLGLALVHKIVLSHNGRIEVESEEGKGTMFHIYLPTRGNCP
jgi:signal transduction histidine kinase